MRVGWALLPVAAAIVVVVGSWVAPASAQRQPAGQRIRVNVSDAAVDASAETSASAATLGQGSDGGMDAGSDAESIEVRRERANSEWALAAAAYRRGAYVEAAQHWQAAYDALPDPLALLNIALSWEAVNEQARAIEYYERYLAEAPEAENRAQVTQHVAELRARPTQVFISSEPPGAFVYVDEDPNPQPTTTPIVLRLAPGPHVVVLDRDGYRRTVRRFVARPGQIETLSISLPADTGYVAPNGARLRMEPRVAHRRAESPLTLRFSFLFGAARPWNSGPLSLSIGAEATLFVGRSLATKVHLERVEPDGVWTLATGDFGYVFLFEDIDIGVYATAGIGYGSLDPAHPEMRRVVPAAGFELRTDWQFHPRLSVGLFFRATWRNFFIAPIEPLNSFGLSVSLSL